jgi:ABC-type multidrug transport system fused ATPase/permease subunit
MLRYRGAVAGSLIMVTLTSLTLGVGLLGAKPVMEAILGNGDGMDALARRLNAWLDEQRYAPPFRFSDAFIATLPSDPFVTLAWLMGALCLLTAFGAATNFGHAYLANTLVNKTATRIRHEAFRALVRGGLRDLWAMGSSEGVSRVVNDTSALANGLTVLVSKAVLQICKGIAALGAAIAFDYRVTFGALLVAPALYTVIRKLGKRIKRGAGAALASQAGLYSTASEVAGALRVVKVYTSEGHEIARFHRENKAMLRELNRVRTARALASPLTEMLSVFLLCGLVLLAGRIIINKHLDPGDFILALGSLAVAGASLKPLTGIINDIQAASPAAERLEQLVTRPMERDHTAKGPVTPLPRHRDSIEFDRVWFTYPAPTPNPREQAARAKNSPLTNAHTIDHPLARAAAIRDLSLRIPHGSRYAFVGPNGSGKTTLLGLIPRLFDPDQGRVLIDNIDLRSAPMRSVRRQIGVVTQEVVLFRATIRENIAYAIQASDEDIIAASKKARCHDFIMAMPHGYDTHVGEGGLGLSGGQRQRIAIARAILRDPSILILDEATSMIDPESEVAISQALTEFSQGRTCLIVAHRLSTVRSCDAIVVMNEGAIVDVGTHDQLIDRCALYRALATGGFS